MSRLVLLGLGDEDVDVLSRIARLSPRPEVLVFHPHEESLILRLAALAEWNVTTRPPQPRGDDVAVVPAASPGAVSEWIESWRSAGARVLPPHSVAVGNAGELLAVASGEPPEIVLAPDAGPAVANAQAGREAEAGPEAEDPVAPHPEAESVETNESDAAPIGEPAFEVSTPLEPEPEAATSPPAAGGEDGVILTGSPAAGGAPSSPAAIDEKGNAMKAHNDPAVSTTTPTPSAPPPADVWASPEGTFRYLVETTLGSGSAVSLWWSGGTDVWVPWVWTGETIPHPAPDLDSGVRVSSAWGEFRVVGTGAGQLNAGALQRVTEDMALRDLMTWRETSRSLGSHGLPTSGADAGQLASWLEPLWPVLGARAALFWRRGGEDWSLLSARGSGLTLSGVFHMPEDLLTATFEGKGTPWRRWDPASGLRLYLSMKSEDLRLPLRLRRLELVLTGGDGGR